MFYVILLKVCRHVLATKRLPFCASRQTMMFGKSANASLHSLHASLQTQVCKLFTHFPKFADMHRKVCRLTCKKFADLLCRKILHCKNKSANTSLQTQVCKHKSTKQVYNVSLQNKSANILHVSRQT